MKVISATSHLGGALVSKQATSNSSTNITNQSDGSRWKFSMFGTRTLQSSELSPQYRRLLILHGAEVGVPQGLESKFTLLVGSIEDLDKKEVFNCIIVSFGLHCEFAYYEIKLLDHQKIFELYKWARREVVMNKVFSGTLV